MKYISSAQNPVIKEVKALKQKKYREETGMFFIEGIRFVEEALKEDISIDKVLVSESLSDVNGGKEILEKVNARGCRFFCCPTSFLWKCRIPQTLRGFWRCCRNKNTRLKIYMIIGIFLLYLKEFKTRETWGL